MRISRFHLNHFYLYATVFVTGAAVLVIEILGTRILAPFYGSTIYVWSSLILVTLAALALGYFIGGRLADTYAYFRSPYPALVLAGIFTVLSTKLSQFVLVYSDKFGLQYGPLIGAFLLFFTPLLLLGAISPTVIKATTQDVQKIGRGAGTVFALGTSGSLAGGYAAGFILIPLFSISKIFLFTGLFIVAVGLVGIYISGGRLRWPVVMVTIIILFPFIYDKSYTATKILYHTNSFYGDIKVTGTAKKPCLYVNGSNQTCVDMDNLKNPDSVFFKQATELIGTLPEEGRALVLGLGGGAINSAARNNVLIDSVEIDPKIIELAEAYFGFKSSPGHTIIVDDARHFVKNAEPGEYDLILEDLSLGSHVPYYVFSRESFAEMKALLKPRGLLVTHIGIGIDDGDKFAEAIIRTAREVFRHVDVYSSHPKLLSNFIVYMYDESSGLSRTSSEYHLYSEMELGSALVMTDDYNLLEKYYLPYAVEELKNSHNIGNQLLFSN